MTSRLMANTTKNMAKQFHTSRAQLKELNSHSKHITQPKSQGASQAMCRQSYTSVNSL